MEYVQNRSCVCAKEGERERQEEVERKPSSAKSNKVAEDVALGKYQRKPIFNVRLTVEWCRGVARRDCKSVVGVLFGRGGESEEEE